MKKVLNRKHRRAHSALGSYIAEPLEQRWLLTSVVVNTLNDTSTPGTTSLRTAILTANSSTTPTTITFDPTIFATSKTITLNGTVLELSNTGHATTITGPSAGVAISGNNLSGVFSVDSGVTATFSGLTITKASGDSDAIDNAGSLTMSEVTVSNNNGYGFDNANRATLNSVTFSNNNAGGVVNEAGATLVVNGGMFTDNNLIRSVQNASYGGGLSNVGTATINGTIFSGNSAIFGGGLASIRTNDGTPMTTVSNCTFSGNMVSQGGGGIYIAGGNATIADTTVSANTTGPFGGNGGGLYLSAGGLTLTNVTIAGNSAGQGGGFDIEQDDYCTINNVTVANNISDGTGGGVYANAFNPINPTVANSVIAGNTASNAGPDVVGAFVSKGYNLIGKADDSTGWGLHDITGSIASPVNAKLGALADNGGPTKTLLPQAGSFAIDGGSNALVPKGTTTDQRGLARIANGTVDIGAVEVQSPVTTLLTVTPPAAQSATLGVAKSFTLGSFTESNATGPYAVDVNWGDGTPDTKFTIAAPGTIPAQTHTYAKAGMDTASIVVTEAKAKTSNKATFAVTVTGVVAAKITLTAPAAQTANVSVPKSFALGSFTASNTTAPYTVDVKWGDGTPDTIFAVTKPGTIPAQTHTYAKTGTDTVSIGVTDAKNNASNKATFAVTVTGPTNTGSIKGNVFKDLNANGVLNPPETGLVGVKVYLDTNKNGKLDTGEPAVTTDAAGNYTFGNLVAGTYRVSEVVPGGYKVIAPLLGYVDETLSTGKAIVGVNFADAPATGSISGLVFNDANVNQKYDATELGLDGWQVYIDANKDGKYDAGDVLATTDITGSWSFTGLIAGTYAVRVVQVSKTATTTAGGALQTITLAGGQVVAGKLFGEERIA